MASKSLAVWRHLLNTTKHTETGFTNGLINSQIGKMLKLNFLKSALSGFQNRWLIDSIFNNKKIGYQMKKFFGTALIIFISNSTPVMAKPVKCDDANTKAIISIAKNNGYDWPGTIQSASCDLGDGYAFVWSSKPGATGGLLAVMQANPARIQFKSSAPRDLFCVRLINGRWENVGKQC